MEKSKALVNKFSEINPNQIEGEVSLRKGITYEDIASFYIIEKFQDVVNKKTKPKILTFNFPEDLTVIDQLNGIYIFQIKKNSSIWEKSDNRFIKFLENSFNRFLIYLEDGMDSIFNQYFFTNSTGKFLIYWEKNRKDNPTKIFDNLPSVIKTKIIESNISDEKIMLFISSIYIRIKILFKQF